jgi:hypothetical protein
VHPSNPVKTTRATRLSGTGSSLFAVGRLSLVALLAGAGGISVVAACSSSSSPPPSTDAGDNADASDAAVDGQVDGALPDDGSDTCDHLATTTYSCAPLPIDQGVCMGGPRQAGDAGAGFSYSLGCQATLPECRPFYPSQTVTCTCSPQGMTGSWTCQL